MTVSEPQELTCLESECEGLVQGFRDLGAGQEGVTGGHRLGSIGHLTGYDAGNTQKGGFFLHSSTIGQDGPAAGQELGEHLGREWWELKDVGWEQGVRETVMDSGIWMNRGQELNLWMAFSRLDDLFEHLRQAASEGFPAMERDETPVVGQGGSR